MTAPSPGSASRPVPIQRAARPSPPIDLKMPTAPHTIRSPLGMRGGLINDQAGPAPAPHSGWLGGKGGGMLSPHMVWRGLMKPGATQRRENRIGPATAPSAIQPAAGRADRVAIEAMGFVLSVTIVVPSLLRQAHFQPDPFRRYGAGLERAFRCQLLEFGRRVGAALEHLERPLRRKGAHPPQVHPLNLALDVRVGGVAAHVLDQGDSTAAQDSMHLR